MRLRADQKLFLSYLALISVLILALSVGADSLLRRHLMRTVEEDLRRELALGVSLYDTNPRLSPDSLAELMGERSGRRVTIITAAGQVVGESSPVPQEIPEGRDYRVRPEVRAAFEVGEGRAIRHSATLGADHLYLAALSQRGEVVRFAVPLSELQRALAGVQRGILLVGLVALILAGLFSLGFSLAVTRPLRRMRDVAAELAAGDLSHRVGNRRQDELGELAGALNTLADELQRRLTQLEGERAEMQALIDSMAEGVLAFSAAGMLRRANPAARQIFGLDPELVGVPPERLSRRPEFLGLVSRALDGESVPPRELAEDDQHLLATAHPLPAGGAVLVFLDVSELRRLEGVRRDFVANVSHELKTPLTAIRGYSETLLDPEVPPELVRRFAETVKLNADRLQRIVDDLLDLSRIEAGGWRVEATPVPLAPLAREIWAAHGEGREGAVELVIDLAPGSETVRADREALRQVFSNLFGNALRYTPAGGRVTVRSRSAGESWPAVGRGAGAAAGPLAWTLVEVQDTGSGIASAHLARIFERFYRVDPARARVEGGTGLGLSIVKHLVEAHGGWIEAESRLGEGTTIRFTLPAVEPER